MDKLIEILEEIQEKYQGITYGYLDYIHRPNFVIKVYDWELFLKGLGIEYTNELLKSWEIKYHYIHEFLKDQEAEYYHIIDDESLKNWEAEYFCILNNKTLKNWEEEYKCIVNKCPTWLRKKILFKLYNIKEEIIQKYNEQQKYNK